MDEDDEVFDDGENDEGEDKLDEDEDLEQYLDD